MNIVLAIVLGIGFATGVSGAVAAMRPPAPSRATLARALAFLDGNTVIEVRERPSLAVAAAERCGLPSARIRADLAVLDHTSGDYLRTLARRCLIAAGAPLAGAAVVAMAGVSVHWLPLLALAGLFGVFAWLFTHAGIHDSAEVQREEYRRVLGIYMHLVTMGLAGGAGIDTSLYTAAGAGYGKAFEAIQTALNRAAVTGQTPWDALSGIGERTGVRAYIQLGASASLAGTEGARVRASFASRAKALRDARQAHIEAESLAAVERMSLPIMLLSSGFLTIIGYPAVSQILGGL